MAEKIDIAVAWDWAYDRDFIALIDAESRRRGLRMSAFGAGEAAGAGAALKSGTIRVGTFLDRADPDEEPFAVLSGNGRIGARCLNPADAMQKAADKATMHLEFLSHGIAVPYTIIISPYSRERQVSCRLSSLPALGALSSSSRLIRREGGGCDHRS